MSYEPRDYLLHILSEADYLIAQSANTSAQTFLADETLRRAFVRSLEIIGEAAKKVPEKFRAQYPQVQGAQGPECATGKYMVTAASTTISSEA